MQQFLEKQTELILFFAPIDLVESLTKTNHLLVADMKGELQSMNNQLSTQSTENLKTKMEALEQGFIELREVVMQRTINNLKPNPELLRSMGSNYDGTSEE